MFFSLFFFPFNPFWVCKTFIHAAVPRLEQVCPHLKAQCATFDPASGIENASADVDSGASTRYRVFFSLRGHSLENKIE